MEPHGEAAGQPPLRAVFTAPAMEARLAMGALHAAGIPVLSNSSGHGPFPTRFSPVTLLVPEPWVVQAVAMLEDARFGGLASAEALGPVEEDSEDLA